MNDLENIAMDALDKAELQDQGESENAVEGSESVSNEPNDEKGSDTAEGSKNSSESELEGNNDNSDEDTSSEKDEESEEKASAEDKKEEMTDEEFEELAKKRGYSKKSEDDRAEESKKAFDNATKRPKEIDRDTWEGMPPINKVIYNNLPYIQAIGKDGNIIRVKTAQQLPDDFEFANKKAELQFQNDLQAQEMKAQKISDNITSRIERSREQEERAVEARNILSEISALQKSGELPTPKAKPGTKAFDDDDAVVLINKVLGYRQERMKAGSNLTVEDALMIYKMKHPSEFENKSEAKGDVERKKVANKISGSNKSADTSISSKRAGKPKYYRYGMSMEDVLDRALDEMDD